MIFSDKVYKILKYLTQIALPAVATLYFTISNLWGLPYTEQIMGTITAIVTCLGVLLGVGTYRYNKNDGGTDGSIIIEDGDDISGSSYVQFDKELTNIIHKPQIKLNVVKEK